jgi:predicted alpha/beta-fold hydrolase
VISVYPPNGASLPDRPSSIATRPICNRTGNLFKAAAGQFPEFQPHRLLRSGHLQTLAGGLLRGKQYRYRAARRAVLLPEGDVMILHDDRPPGWQPTSPVALLIHGLSGSHQSHYMIRIAGKLNEVGVRTFRLDARGSGSGEGLSRKTYHGGCSHDLGEALQAVAELCPAAPIHLVGFSIGGNTALKLIGETDQLPSQLSSSVTINPPIDLGYCVERFTTGPASFYDGHVVKSLYRQICRSGRLVEQAPHVPRARMPRGQREFDSLYTANVWGFDSVDQFYADTSSRRVISDVHIPSLLIASRDDPLVPVELFEQLELPDSITLCLADHGGHLGFIGQAGEDQDRRWMDWRIVDWITAPQHLPQAAAA